MALLTLHFFNIDPEANVFLDYKTNLLRKSTQVILLAFNDKIIYLNRLQFSVLIQKKQ